ncbi:MAG: hypothetical protein ACSW8B_01660 [bacterium]
MNNKDFVELCKKAVADDFNGQADSIDRKINERFGWQIESSHSGG